MNTKIICYLVVLLLAVSTSAQEDAQIHDSQRVGSFTEIPLEQIKLLDSEASPSFIQLQEFVRKEVSTKSYFQDREIGKVTKIEVQIVSGRNFRYTFENSKGEVFTATVFDQPWTNTRQLTHINFASAEEM